MWLLQNFAHAMTALLSWHVQRFVWSDGLWLNYSEMKFSLNLKFEQKTVSEMGPSVIHICIDKGLLLIWQQIIIKTNGELWLTITFWIMFTTSLFLFLFKNCSWKGSSTITQPISSRETLANPKCCCHKYMGSKLVHSCTCRWSGMFGWMISLKTLTRSGNILWDFEC